MIGTPPAKRRIGQVKSLAKSTVIGAALTALFGGGLAPALFSTPAIAQQAYGIAATVNDDVITTYDLEQRVFFMLMASGVKPDEDSLRRIQLQALRALVDERLQLQEAKKFDLEIGDAEVERSVARLAQGNNMTVEEISQQMASVGVSLSTLRDQVRAELAWQKIVNGRFGPRIRISDTQIDETIRRITANVGKPSFLVSELYIEATPDIGGMDGAIEGGKAMITQLGQGAPFTALARQFSSAASAAKGGDVGWVREGELRPEVNLALAKLDKGETSEIIQVPGGVYVVTLRDKRVSTSETVFKIKQLRIPAEDDAGVAAASAAIKGLQGNVKDCDALDAAIKPIPNATAVDMGEVKSSQIAGEILVTLEKTAQGEISDPIVAPNGAMALMVCDIRVQGAGIPTRDEVEDQLTEQQIAQSSKRYLRDIRRGATIESR